MGVAGYRVARPGVRAVLTAPDNRAPTPRLKVLWLDLLPALRADVAPAIREAVEALALFQRWLFGTTNSQDINIMITEREEKYGIHAHPEWAPVYDAPSRGR